MAAAAGRLARRVSGVRTLFSLPLSSFSLGSVGFEVQVPSTTNWRGVRSVSESADLSARRDEVARGVRYQTRSNTEEAAARRKWFMKGDRG